MSDGIVERVRRLLFLLSYVARQGNKGMLVERAYKAAGYANEREFYEAIRFVNMIGPPAGSPDEFMQVDVENGRVYVSIPSGFSRPTRLSFAEAAALLAAAGPLRHSEGDVLTSALDKVRKAVPAGCLPALEDQVRVASIQASERIKWHAIFDDAIARRMEVTLHYYSPARGKAGARVIEPRMLFTQSAHWYAVAWSVKDGKEKLYRLDRIMDAKVGARCFGEHKGSGVERTVLFADQEMHPEAEVRFARKLARLAHEQFGAQAHDSADGSVSVKTRMASETYAVNWALGYGGAVRIVSPPAWQKALEKRAKELLARHS
jgi:proteasome accessory factor C